MERCEWHSLPLVLRIAVFDRLSRRAQDTRKLHGRVSQLAFGLRANLDEDAIVVAHPFTILRLALPGSHCLHGCCEGMRQADVVDGRTREAMGAHVQFGHAAQ